jgi:histidine triad (HIT) family protein
MASIFTRIINGEIPCYKVAESDDYLAFLDIRPTAKGHTLVVPKIEVDNLWHLDADILAGLILFAQRVAQAIPQVISCKRVGMAVVGTEIAHAHIHLIPFQYERQMNVDAANLELTPDEMAQIAESIRSHFQ